jgi:hypothetical protein
VFSLFFAICANVNALELPKQFKTATSEDLYCIECDREYSSPSSINKHLKTKKHGAPDALLPYKRPTKVDEKQKKQKR